MNIYVTCILYSIYLLDGICKRTKLLLNQSVNRNHADALLLSGGLDSSILASILNPKCSLTVSLGNNTPDLEFAKSVAARYSEKHIEIILTDEKLLEIIEQVIRILKTFDPMEIRNSSVVFVGMKVAQENGYANVMTGDGGDELFAGYNYLRRYFSNTANLDAELRRLWDKMHFSSLQIAKTNGIEVKTPFLDEKFSAYAKSIDVSEKIGKYGGYQWGKFILRKCFELELGKEIVWRQKFAQEQGAGTVKIKNYFSNNFDEDYQIGTKQALSAGVKIRDKEHLYYYKLFRKYFSSPKDEECSYLRCPECNGCFNSIGKFCRICGAFPVIPVLKKW
jgi:asparagine synthase (glutamine-hydrolysing)